MTENELLWFIFVDSLTSNFAFITNSELAIWAAPKLSHLNFKKILAPACAGVFCASIINYVFGIICSNIFSVVVKNNNKATQNIGLLKSAFNNFGVYLLVLGFIPIYSKFVVLFAGFARYKFVRVILIVTIVKTIFYAYCQD